MRLILSGDDEAGLLVDPGSGFSMALPGHPYQTVTLEHPEVPRHDARVMIKDVPVEVRCRLDARPEDMKAAPLAVALAQAFASNRSQGKINVQPAQEAQRRAWGVEAAASVIYPLKRFDPSGADTEEVLVLIRDQRVMTITRAFPGAFTDSLRWTLFNTASNGSIAWTGDGEPPEAPPVIWPESTFLKPGVLGVLRPERRAQALTLSKTLSTTLIQRVAPRLETLLFGSEPPSTPLDATMRRFMGDYLLEVFEGTDAAALILTCLPELHNAHDSRGLALMLLRAVSAAASRT